MVDQYYRKIESVENNIENTMQISGILLKLKGYDDDLSKIDTNEGNISNNSNQISTNTESISSNLTKIGDNKNNIDGINENLSNIDFNSGNKYSIENFFIYNIEIEKSYNLNKDKTSFSIFKYTLEDKFTKDSFLEIDTRLLYRYNNYNHIGLLQHVFKLYDDKDNIFHDYKSLITNAGDNTRNDIKQNDFFSVKLNENYGIIKIELILSLINDISNTTSVDCRLYNTYKSNFLNVKYYKKINLISVNNNLGDIKNDILSKIDTNKANILSNLIKINETTKLKNIYFTDFDSTDKAFVKELLHLNNTLDKSRTGSIHSIDMEYNFKKNDFIVIDCKLLISHNSYDNAKNNIVIHYDLYDEKVDDNNLLFRESRRYHEFPLITNKDRIIAYTKICYKVKYDINKIKFLVLINSITRKTHLILYHYIIQKGVNYISVKHYRKS